MSLISCNQSLDMVCLLTTESAKILNCALMSSTSRLFELPYGSLVRNNLYPLDDVEEVLDRLRHGQVLQMAISRLCCRLSQKKRQHHRS